MSTLTTPKLGFPYPDGAERVMDGDNAIGALALAVENAMHPALRDMVPAYVRSTAQLTLTTTEVAVPGCTLTFTAPSAEVALILCSFDLNLSVAGAGGVNGAIYVDAATRGSGPGFATSGVHRDTVSGSNIATYSAGNHTIDLRARKTAAGGTATCESASLSAGSVSATYMIVLRFKQQPALLALLDAVGADVG